MAVCERLLYIEVIQLLLAFFKECGKKTVVAVWRRSFNGGGFTVNVYMYTI